MMMFHYRWPYAYGNIFWGWILPGLFWLLIIVLVISFFKGERHEFRSRIHDTRSPTDILKERYAKGEIDKKQYEEIKRDLKD
jgi:putative membrane protein